MKKLPKGYSGGIATLSKYGTAFYSELGKKGGRPQAKTLSDLTASNNKNERGLDEPSNNLAQLKRLLTLRYKGVIADSK